MLSLFVALYNLDVGKFLSKDRWTPPFAAECSSCCETEHNCTHHCAIRIGGAPIKPPTTTELVLVCQDMDVNVSCGDRLALTDAILAQKVS